MSVVNMLFLITSVIAFFGAIGIAVEVNRNIEKVAGTRCFLFACVSILIWAGCTVFYIAEPIIDVTIRWYKIKFIGELFYPLLYMLFVITFNWKDIEFRKRYLVILSTIPIAILFVMFSGISSSLLGMKIEVVKVLPYKELEVSFGLVNILFFGYVLLLEFAGLSIFLFKFFSSSAIYKSRIVLFILAGIISTTFFTIEMLNEKKVLDLYLIGGFIKLVIAYWALMKYNASDFMILAKDTVFEKISCVAFVLDMDRKILDSNPRAKELFKTADIELDNVHYSNVLERWMKAKSGKMTENNEGQLMYFKLAGKTYYYQIVESEIKDKKSRSVGTFIEMRDVTRQQELILELFKLVNQDQLTGLYNRRYFEHMFVELDKPSCYPLGIISGDLNKLKQTNDTYGHIVGDRLIALMAEILKRSVPRTAIVSRYGGDEFFILIPRTSETEMNGVIKTIKENAGAIYEEPFGTISISLGYAIKEAAEDDLNRIKSDADMKMYEDKKIYHKKTGEEIRKSKPEPFADATTG